MPVDVLSGIPYVVVPYVLELLTTAIAAVQSSLGIGGQIVLSGHPVDALGAVALEQEGFLSELEVAYTEGQLGVLAVSGNEPDLGGGRLSVGGVLNAVGAGQRSDADVAQTILVMVLGAVGTNISQRGVGGNADNVLVLVHGGQQVVVGVGEGFLHQQAFVNQLLQVVSSFEPAILDVGNGNVAFSVQHEHVVVAFVNERVGQELISGAAETGGGDEGDFIVGVAVAVSILLLEGNQHVVELFGGGGNFQTEVLQIGLVDPHLVLGLVGGRVLDVGNTVQGAVGVGQGGDQVPGRELSNSLIDVGSHTGLDVGHQVDESAGIAVGLGGGNVQAVVDNVSQLFTGGDHDVQLIAGIGSGQPNELNVNTGLLFEPQGVHVGLVVFDVVVLLHQDGELRGLIASPDRQFAGSAQGGVRYANGGEAGESQNQSHDQRQGLLHGVILLKMFYSQQQTSRRESDGGWTRVIP